jgi:asparagine synthase (glutamine-hydrolysing)
VSAIYGIVSLGEAPVDAALVPAMEAALVHRPADATGHFVSHRAALGVRALWVCPEARGQDLPFRDREAGLLCVADGRLDDREALASRLGVPASVCDEALLCAAYRRFGADFAAELAGDFACAVYDQRAERLVLARDAYGLRALYYAQVGDALLFASQARPLFAHQGLGRRLDPLRVAQYLARDFGDAERTFFRGVSRLAPGHVLVAEHGQLRGRRYFAFEPRDELRLPSSAAYAERFQELFVAAVKDRARSHLGVGCLLSGGLDSSGVLGALRRLDPGRDVPCFSARFRSLPAIDEGPYLDLLARQGGLSRHELDADQAGPLDDIDRVYDELDEPFHAPNLFIYRQLSRLARAHGVHVLLDGLDGDTVVEHGVYFLAELLDRLKLRRLGRELSALHRRTGLSYRTLLSSWTLGPFADRARARATWLGLRRPPYLRRGFAEESGYAMHARAAAVAQLEVPVEFRALHHRAVTAPIVPFYLEVHDKAAAAAGVDHRHPFFDRRLIEFCLALPAEQRLHDGWDRVIERRAFAGLAPEEIRARQSKSVWTENFQTQLFTRHGALIDSVISAPDSPLAPFCDLGRLRRARYRLAVGARPERVHDLWCAVTLGLWLRRHSVSL